MKRLWISLEEQQLRAGIPPRRLDRNIDRIFIVWNYKK